MESSAGVKSSCSFCSSRDAYDFDCNICYELPKEPIVTLCGHLFCRPCLARWLGIHSGYTHIKKCPTCLSPVMENTLIPLYGKGMKCSTPLTFKENRFVQHVFVTIRAFMALMSVTLLTSWLLRPVHLLQNEIFVTTRDVRNYVQCLLEPVHDFQNKIFASTLKVNRFLTLWLLRPIHLLQNEIWATTQDVRYFVQCLMERVHDFRNKIFASTLEVNHFLQCLFDDLKNQVCGLPLEGKLFVRCLIELIHDLPNKIFTNRTVLDSPPRCCEQDFEAHKYGTLIESSAGVNSGCSFCSSRDDYDFNCNICYELLKEPIVTLCGHLSRRPCLSRWFDIQSSYKNTKLCPACKAPITENKLIPLYGKGIKSSVALTSKHY